jgi:L-lactate dehydrogenase
MAKIVIIGVGSVGATLGYTLQLLGLANEIVLIDVNQELVQGQVMDMNHGLFFVPPAKIHAGDYADCSTADVIIITAGSPQNPGENRLALADRNARVCKTITDSIMPFDPKGVVLVVTNPVDIMTHVVLNRSGLSPSKVIGSGTVLDSARFRYLISNHCTIDARNVHAYVIGEHGDSEVLLWSQVRIAGTPLEQFCKQCGRNCTEQLITNITEAVKNSAYHIIEAKGATTYGVALAVQRIVEAIIRDENSVLTVSTLLNGKYGIYNSCVSIPCVLNKNGIDTIVENELNQNEAKALRQSAQMLHDIAAN